MKKFFILLMSMVGLSTTIHAQVTIDETNFPDANFRAYLLSQSYGQDGIITDEEIAEINEMNIYNKGISDLTGIGYFTELEELMCYNNQLTSFDVSSNTKLTGLDCEDNQLTSLDVSNNPELTYLWCYNNQLTSLDLSNCPGLQKLSCENNKLSEEAMFAMVTSLPDRHDYYGVIWAIDLSSSTEGNVCSTTTVDVARTINWLVYARTVNGEWELYEGSEPTQTGVNEIDAAKMGNSIRYNLMGQPVGNDYKGIVIENGQKIIVKYVSPQFIHQRLTEHSAGLFHAQKCCLLLTVVLLLVLSIACLKKIQNHLKLSYRTPAGRGSRGSYANSSQCRPSGHAREEETC